MSLLGPDVLHFFNFLLVEILFGLESLLAKLFLLVFNPFTFFVVLLKLRSVELFSLSNFEFELLCDTVVYRNGITFLILLLFHTFLSSLLHLEFVVLETILDHLYFFKLL